jgi:hypothetical protein
MIAIMSYPAKTFFLWKPNRMVASEVDLGAVSVAKS